MFHARKTQTNPVPRPSRRPRPASGTSLPSGPVSPDADRPDETAERAGMTENGGKSKLSSLTFRQQAALPVIAAAPSVAQAARDSGVGESTLRRWLDAPAFLEDLLRYRQETAGLARQELQALMLRSVSVIASAMEDPNPSIRLRAARYALSFGFKISEIDKLSESIQELSDFPGVIAARQSLPVNSNPIIPSLWKDHPACGGNHRGCPGHGRGPTTGTHYPKLQNGGNERKW